MSTPAALDTRSLRCRLQPTGFGQKSALKKQPEDKVTGVIRFLSKQDAEELLKDRPIGSIILRLRGTALTEGKSTLVVSYKYYDRVVHRDLKILLKIKVKAEAQMIICKVDPKTFKWIQTSLIPFLEQVAPFINEFCQNKNWVERDMNELELEKELTFRKFVIFPENVHITVLKKSDLKRHGPKSFSVAIDFSECRFVAIKNSGETNTFTRVSSFNEVLLDFLNIRSTDTFLVMGALGYNPKELKENVSRDRSYSFARNRQLPKLGKPGTSLSGKEREELINMISAVNVAGLRELPDQVVDALATTYSALLALDSQPAGSAWDAKIVSADKMGWIQGGIFHGLVNLAVAAASESNFPDQLKLPLDIIKLLLKNFTWACERFYEYLWAHLSSMSGGVSDDQAPLAITYLISEAIYVPAFAQTFLQSSGVDRLLAVFHHTLRGLMKPPTLLTASGSSSSNNHGTVSQAWASTNTKPGSLSAGSRKNPRPSVVNTFKDTEGGVGGGGGGGGGGSIGSGGAEKSGSGGGGGSMSSRSESSTKSNTILQKLSKARVFAAAARRKSRPDEKGSNESSADSFSADEEENSPAKSPKKPSAVPLLFFGAGSSDKPSPVVNTRSNRRKSAPRVARGPLVPVPDQTVEDSSSSSFSAVSSAMEQLGEIARLMGETQVASDLTVMLGFKQLADVRARRRLTRMPVAAENESPALLGSADPETLANIGFATLDKKSPQYQARCYILKTLAVLMEDPKFRKFARSPVNLIFAQLTHPMLRPALESDDGSYRKLLYRVLQSVADEVEVLHSRHWGEQTKGMILTQVLRHRRKLDLLTSRVHSRIRSSYETKNFDDLETQLRVLGDYLAYCSSRVISSQVVDACMETLLQVKNYVFHTQFDPTNVRLIKLVYLLLRVFDELAAQTEIMPLNDLLLTILAYKSEAWEYIREFAATALTNPATEAAFAADQESGGGDWFSSIKVQAIRHYTTIVKMIRKQYQVDSGDKLTVLLTQDSVQKTLMSKFEFLVFPTSIMQKQLSAGNQYTNFPLKQEILKFLHVLFGSKYCSFTTDNIYIDSYISFHYMQVIRLYNNYALDTPTLVLCRGHLRVLLDFATQKDSKAAMKFYQLRTVDFLTHEVSLEYETKVKRKRFWQEMSKKESDHKQPRSTKSMLSRLHGDGTASSLHASSGSPGPQATSTSQAPSRAAGNIVSGGFKLPDSITLKAKRASTPDASLTVHSGGSSTSLGSGLIHRQSVMTKSAGDLPRADGLVLNSVGPSSPHYVPSASAHPSHDSSDTSSADTSTHPLAHSDGGTSSPHRHHHHHHQHSGGGGGGGGGTSAGGAAGTAPQKSVSLAGGVFIGSAAGRGGSPHRGSEGDIATTMLLSPSKSDLKTKPRANSIAAPEAYLVPKLDLDALAANREGSSRPAFLLQHLTSMEKRQKHLSLEYPSHLRLQKQQQQQQQGPQKSATEKKTEPDVSPNQSTPQSAPPMPFVKRAKSMDLGPATRMLSAKGLVPKAASKVLSPKGSKALSPKSTRHGSSPRDSDAGSGSGSGYGSATAPNKRKNMRKSIGGLSAVSPIMSPSSSNSTLTSGESITKKAKRQSGSGSVTPPTTSNPPSRRGSKRTLTLPAIQEKEKASEDSTGSKSEEKRLGGPASAPSPHSVLITIPYTPNGSKHSLSPSRESPLALSALAAGNPSGESEDDSFSPRCIPDPVFATDPTPSPKLASSPKGPVHAVQTEAGSAEADSDSESSSSSSSRSSSSSSSSGSSSSGNDSSKSSSRGSSSSSSSSSSDLSAPPKLVTPIAKPAGLKGFAIPKLTGLPSKGVSLTPSNSNGSLAPIHEDQALPQSSIAPPKPKGIAIPKLGNLPSKGVALSSSTSGSATTSTSTSPVPVVSITAPAPGKPKGLGLGLNLSGITKGAPVTATGSSVPKLNLPAKTANAATSTPLKSPSMQLYDSANPPPFDPNAALNWEEMENDPDLEVTNRRPGERRYTLTSMESNLPVLKMQVVMDRQRLEKEKAEEEEAPPSNDPNEAAFLARLEEDLYKNERDNKKIYADPGLHRYMLELLIVLMLTPDGNSLDTLYSTQYPVRDNRTNIPYILWMHLNHPANASIVAPLSLATKKRGSASAFRMLKLLSTRLFQPSLYKDLVHIGDGSYGVVYSCKLLGETVAVKQMPLSKSFGDRCVLHDIFAEILVLDKWKNDHRICTLLDYGLDDENYWVVMKKYRTSLGDWRKKQKRTWDVNLALYLNIYMEILQRCRFLADNQVNHYDIKLDNFLIDPLDPDATNDELYNRAGKTVNSFYAATDDPDMPYFSICIADFGEALVYSKEEDGYTTDNRGTEFIKSPEMLNVAYAGRVERQTYDRRRKEGANKASDVWSLGCLLYELLTGEFLFVDHDWVRFRQTVCSPNEELIKQKHREKLRENPHLLQFLHWILVRDPAYRPTIADVIQRFTLVRKECMKEIVAKRKAANEKLDRAVSKRRPHHARNGSEWGAGINSARGDRSKSPEPRQEPIHLGSSTLLASGGAGSPPAERSPTASSPHKELRKSSDRAIRNSKRASVDPYAKSKEKRKSMELSETGSFKLKRGTGIVRSESSKSPVRQRIGDSSANAASQATTTAAAAALSASPNDGGRRSSSSHRRRKSEQAEGKKKDRGIDKGEAEKRLDASSTSASSSPRGGDVSARTESSSSRGDLSSRGSTSVFITNAGESSTPRKRIVSTVAFETSSDSDGDAPTPPLSGRTEDSIGAIGTSSGANSMSQLGGLPSPDLPRKSSSSRALKHRSLALPRRSRENASASGQGKDTGNEESVRSATGSVVLSSTSGKRSKAALGRVDSDEGSSSAEHTHKEHHPSTSLSLSSVIASASHSGGTVTEDPKSPNGKRVTRRVTSNSQKSPGRSPRKPSSPRHTSSPRHSANRFEINLSGSTTSSKDSPLGFSATDLGSTSSPSLVTPTSASSNASNVSNASNASNALISSLHSSTAGMLSGSVATNTTLLSASNAQVAHGAGDLSARTDVSNTSQQSNSTTGSALYAHPIAGHMSASMSSFPVAPIASPPPMHKLKREGSAGAVISSSHSQVNKTSARNKLRSLSMGQNERARAQAAAAAPTGSASASNVSPTGQMVAAAAPNSSGGASALQTAQTAQTAQSHSSTVPMTPNASALLPRASSPGPAPSMSHLPKLNFSSSTGNVMSSMSLHARDASLQHQQQHHHHHHHHHQLSTPSHPSQHQHQAPSPPPLSGRESVDSNSTRDSGASELPDLIPLWRSENEKEKTRMKKAVPSKHQTRRVLTDSDLPVERLKLIDEKERAFFETHPVPITPYLLMGCYDVLKHKITLKRKYGVTHVINCTPLPNISAEHFEYMNINITDRPNAHIVEFFNRTFQFVHAAAVSDGCVLIVGQPEVKMKNSRGTDISSSSSSSSGNSQQQSSSSSSQTMPSSARGMMQAANSRATRVTSFNSPSLNLSVALVTAILMETQHCSFFEALQETYQARYVSQITLSHAQQLSDWEMILNSQRNFSREEYSCLCSTNTITMLQPFEKNITRKVLSCSCKPGKSSNSPCPCGSCDTFLAELRLLRRTDATIDWAFTTIDDVARDLDYVDEFNPPAPLTRDFGRSPEDPTWKPFRCRKCNFIIYAIHKLDPTVMAVCTNNRVLLN